MNLGVHCGEKKPITSIDALIWADVSPAWTRIICRGFYGALLSGIHFEGPERSHGPSLPLLPLKCRLDFLEKSAIGFKMCIQLVTIFAPQTPPKKKQGLRKKFWSGSGFSAWNTVVFFQCMIWIEGHLQTSRASKSPSSPEVDLPWKTSQFSRV